MQCSPEQTARAFFEACSREDWNAAGQLNPNMTDSAKEFLGGLTIVNVGQSFTSADYAGMYVPYEIKLRNGTNKKHKLALRNDHSKSLWQVDGGI